MDARIQDLPFEPAALQQLCVDSLAGDGAPMPPAMQLALAAHFGSVERWREAFVAMGTTLGGGSGRVLLVFRPREGTLVNQRATDPTPAQAGGVPILALDMHGHAPQLDAGAKASAAVDALMGRIDWAAVHARYQAAVNAASDALAVAADGLGAAQLLDVRRAGAFEQARTMIGGARWCDPATVAGWAAELSAEREWVVYCVYGHEVSRAVALRLRAAGLNARFLSGGIDGWQSAGRPLVDKAPATPP